MGRLTETRESVKALHVEHLCTMAEQSDLDASAASKKSTENRKRLDELQLQLKDVGLLRVT